LSIDSKRIIYANPYKSDSDIKHSVKQNIDVTVIDSVNELNKLRDKNIEVLVRIKVNDKDSLMPFSSKFGANYEETLDILKLAKKYNKNIAGFSFHVGSGCYNPVQYYDAVKNIYDIINKTRDLKHDYKIVDIGGGFNGESDEKFIEQANNILKGMKLFKDSNLEFISEPGRYFATKSHTLYVPIIAKKRSNNKNVYVIDESVYSSFSNITYDVAKPKLELTKQPQSKKEYDSIVFGRTCDSADKIIETKLPELEIGDYFIVKNMGAYTTASSTTFNGFEQTQKIYL
jgi:ornithine decarboxylase